MELAKFVCVCFQDKLVSPETKFLTREILPTRSQNFNDLYFKPFNLMIMWAINLFDVAFTKDKVGKYVGSLLLGNYFVKEICPEKNPGNSRFAESYERGNTVTEENC